MSEDQIDTETYANDSATSSSIDTELTQPCSRSVLEQTRRDLIVMREAHGANSPIGHRCSNIVELIQMPEVAAALVARQVDDLQRLLAAQ